MSIRACVVLLVSIGSSTLAGPLNPPAGAIASSNKTLLEIEPGIVINSTNTPGDADSVFKITQPGRYYLTADVVGQVGKHGIEVEASHVYIDLKGYQVRGVPGSLAGIDPNGTAPNSPTSAAYGTLKNGVVTGWGSDGLKGNNVGAWVFEEVKFTSNTGYGCTVNSGSVFTRCYFYLNSLDGAATSNHVEFNQCFSSLNAGHGFSAGSDSQLVACEAGSNGASGIVIPLGGRVTACTVTLNNQSGIIVGDGGSVDNCHVDDNREGGIIVGQGGTVSRCTVDGNGTSTSHHGIHARLFSSTTTTTATVTDCIVYSNTGIGIQTAGGSIRGCMAEANGSSGISMHAAGVVTQCAARANTGVGIFGSQSVSITSCTSSANGTHGIQVSDDCLVRGNTCDSNGVNVADGAGIFIFNQTIPIGTNSDNRIEENNVSDNDLGIWIDDSGNIIIRNSASGNTTNYDIAAGNAFGTIVNAVGLAITTSNSYANFEY